MMWEGRDSISKFFDYVNKIVCISPHEGRIIVRGAYLMGKCLCRMAQAQLGAASPQEKAALAELKARMSSRLLPFRDPNGFRKLLVLLSKSGVLPSPPSKSLLL